MVNNHHPRPQGGYSLEGEMIVSSTAKEWSLDDFEITGLDHWLDGCPINWERNVGALRKTGYEMLRNQLQGVLVHYKVLFSILQNIIE